MICEQCTYLLELGGGCLPTSFSATDQLSLLSGSLTPAESSENALLMDGSPTCECGRGMFDCSIHPSTPESWTAFMRDSLAKTLASLESRQAYLREPDQVFTVKSCESLAWYDQSSCSWRTYQQSFLTDSEPYSETWPRWGMTVGGSAFAHPMSERRITETDGFSWATPTSRDWKGHTITNKHPQGFNKNICNDVKLWPTPTVQDSNKATKKWREDFQNNLTAAVFNPQKMFPTPTAHNAKEKGSPSQLTRNTVQLGDLAGGNLNPNWVGWLMGFPIGWANSKATATPKSRSKQQRPTDSSEDSK